MTSADVRDTRDTRDIAGQRVTPANECRDSRDTGVTAKTLSEQHLSSDVTAVTGVTAEHGTSSYANSAGRRSLPCKVCGQPMVCGQDDTHLGCRQQIVGDRLAELEKSL